MHCGRLQVHSCMQDILGLPEARPGPRRRPLSPPEELDQLLEQSEGDFRTLLAFERSTAKEHGGDAEASPYFRSLRRGGGHIMWNLTYGTFGAGKLQNPPLTERPAKRSDEEASAIRAGGLPIPLPPCPFVLRACQHAAVDGRYRHPFLCLRDAAARTHVCGSLSKMMPNLSEIIVQHRPFCMVCSRCSTGH